MTNLKPYPFSTTPCDLLCQQHNIAAYKFEHPVQLINLIDNYHELEVEVCWYDLGDKRDSLYNISPNNTTWSDQREYRWIPATSLTLDYISDMENMCKLLDTDLVGNKLTLGWSCRFRDVNGNIFFMPGFDGGSDLGPKLILSHEDIFPYFIKYDLPDPVFARTDSSMHIYFPTLLPWDQFNPFIGSILLMDMHKTIRLADHNWIAASLIRQRPILRLCKKYGVPQESSAPRLMDPWSPGASLEQLPQPAISDMFSVL